ncbi:MAG: M1 family aminopeptidase [Ktedonobacterales bacterium]
MYTCGSGDLTHLLFGQFGADLLGDAFSGPDGDAPTFSLPGDKPIYAPDRAADVRHMDINVTLDFETKTVHGDVTLHFTALFEQVHSVTLDAAEFQISAITQADTTDSDASLNYWTEGEKLVIHLTRAYQHGEEFAVRVRYSVQPRTGLVFVGPEPGNSDLPEQVWTQGETEYHHFWLPCHDFPNDRATTTLAATVPARFFALSNGRLEEAHDNGDGTKTYRWRQEVAFPAYLITLVAGEFVEIENHWRDTPVNSWVRAGREDDAHRMFDKTPAMIEYYTTHFGVDYPYVKYGQIVAEKFTGAMENVSATTHTYRLLPDQRASLDFTPEPVVAHELVHQWFGDLLAVRDWAHTWLKESFATYFASTWMEHDEGLDEFREDLREQLADYLAGDARGRRPIVYNVYHKNGNELFDVHNYPRGSRVLHMLRTIVGDAPFWRGIQRYAQRNQGREVITADLERAMEEATGRSLAQFFSQWVYKAGYPEFTVNYSWDGERHMAKVTVKQTQQVTEITPLFETPVDLAFFVPERDGASPDDLDAPMTPVVFRVTVDQAEQTFYLPLARRPFGVRFDYGAWLIKTLTFERPAELLRYQLRRDPDVVGRMEAAEALGKLGGAINITALGEALVAEPFWAVRRDIAQALGETRSEQALDILCAALEAINEPKARRGIVAALGAYHAPEQTALAERAAATLIALLDRGEPSYYVTAAAATALGKTRASGAYDRLLALVYTPSWNEVIRSGVFTGLGELGEPRVVETLATWATDQSKPMDARAAATGGMRTLATTKRIDQGKAQTRAIEALCQALDDSWELVVFGASAALAAWGDPRALPALQRLVASSPDERAVRTARMAIRAIQRGDSAATASRQLRADLDTLREENRTLHTRLDALEAQASHANDSHASDS